MPRIMEASHLGGGGKPMKLIGWSLCAASLLVLHGCWSLDGRVDQDVRAMTAYVDYVAIHPALDPTPVAAPKVNPPSPEPASSSPEKKETGAPAEPGPGLQPPPEQPKKNRPERPEVPPGLPGADAPPITKKNFTDDPDQRSRLKKEIFPPYRRRLNWRRPHQGRKVGR